MIRRFLPGLLLASRSLRAQALAPKVQRLPANGRPSAPNRAVPCSRSRTSFERPSEFRSPKGSKVLLVRYQRVP